MHLGDTWSRNKFISFFRRLPSVVGIVFFSVSVTTVAWLFVLKMTAHDLALEMRRINSENVTLAHSLEEHVARAVKTTDNALLFLKREYEAQGTTTQRMVNFIDEQRRDPLLNQIGLANSRGDLLLSAVPLTKPINIAHREHFQVQAASATAGLFIAKPVVNQVSGVWSIFLTRRLSGADGSFAGVVTAGIDPRYFSDYFDDLELGPDRTIILVGRDGIIRSRRFQQLTEVGQDISSSPLFKHIRSADIGSYEVVSPVDGLPKLASFHTVRGTSLIVVVSEVKEKALAGFQKRKRTNYAVVIFFTFFTAVFCVSLIRSVRLAGRQNVRLAEELAEYERAAAALQEREKQLAESQRIAHVGSWEHNMATGKVVWSDEFFRLFGLDPRKDPADFKMFLECIHPDDQPALKKAIDETVQTGKHFSIDYRFIRRDGTTRILNAQAELKHDETGTQPILSGTGQDITERKAAENAVRESENKFRTLFNSINDSILIFGLGRTFLEANEFVCRRLGYSREELLALSPKDIDTPEAAKNVPENIGNLLEKGKHHFESEQLARDGRRIPVEISASVIDYDGQQAILAVCRDITERKLAEQELRRSEEFIKSILDSVDDGYLVVDKTLRIIAANQAFCRQTNRSLGEVIGQLCHDIPHPALRQCREPEQQCPARKTFETGLPCTALQHQGDSAGQEMAAEIRSFPLIDSAGNVQSVILTVRDVTAKLKTEERLRNAQKLESVGILAGGIAHDFNNLLCGILGNISLAQMLLPADEQPRALLRQAEEACEHGKELSGRLLTFAKGGEPVKKTVLLQKTLRDSVTLALSGSNVSAVFNMAEGLSAIAADEGQMRQVFNNLTINAREAMPGGGTVEVGAENQLVAPGEIPALREGQYVKITFRDHGRGIPQQIIDRIFDPYFSTKEMGSRKGQGLGLTICHSIVRRHDGQITVATEPGSGTVFTIYLSASRHASAEQGSAPVRKEGGSQTGAKILVMDDDARVRDLLGRMLKHFGHTVDLFPDSSGTIRAYAAALAAGTPYSLVILDLTIQGGKGGAETFRDLQDIDPHVRAIISSGYAADPILENYTEHGFAGAIIKPYSAVQLRTVLASILHLPV